MEEMNTRVYERKRGKTELYGRKQAQGKLGRAHKSFKYLHQAHTHKKKTRPGFKILSPG